METWERRRVKPCVRHGSSLPGCSVDVTWAPWISLLPLTMSSGLSQCLMKRSSSWLLPSTAALTRVDCRVWGSTSSATQDFTSFQSKPRTLKDLPHVSSLEMIYRVVCQGFYKRLHELQVGQPHPATGLNVDVSAFQKFFGDFFSSLTLATLHNGQCQNSWITSVSTVTSLPNNPQRPGLCFFS